MMSNKRKADEIEVTCNTWLTTRNKKQDLKEFESNRQRLSEQRIRLMKLSRRPVGIITNTRQSKLPEFFKNPNLGKENKCTEKNIKVIQKSNKKIKGQLTSISRISTNKKQQDKYKYFNSFNNKSSEESIQNSCTCTLNTGSCEINNSEGSIHESLTFTGDNLMASIEGASTVADRNKFSDIQDYENIHYKDDNKHRNYENSLLDKFENDMQSIGHSFTSSSPCLDYSDSFFRNTPIAIQDGGIDSQISEEFKECLDVPSKLDLIQVYEDGVQLETDIDHFPSKYESQESGNLKTAEQSDFSEVEQSGGCSLGNLRLSIDSEEHVLRLRESCTSVKGEHSEFLEISIDSSMLTSGESYTNNCNSEITNVNKSNELYIKDSKVDNMDRLDSADHSKLLEKSVDLSIIGETCIDGNRETRPSNAKKSSGELYFEDSQLDDNRSDCTFLDLELDSNGSFIDPLNTVEQFSFSSDSIDLVENSNGCLQIRRS